MPRKQIKKIKKVPEIDDWKKEILKTGLYPETPDNFEVLHFFYSDLKSEDLKLELYEQIRVEFLKDWIQANPCTRPWSWWQYDCPRQKDADKGCFWHGTLPEERLHMGGGRQSTMNYFPVYYKSIFRYWHFENDAPPMFESEAAFLKRLNLLTDDELQHLKKHPELLEPESIVTAIPGIKSQ